jgi:ring-1,2-phenylacetyl-CoA epoxidase subunit PaaC
MASDRQLLEYVLRLADSDLILAQRLGEWVGHGPVLEEDIALTNVGLDLLGQARLWFAYAGEIEARGAQGGRPSTARSEDEFAFMREGGGFRNLLLAEQPNGNYANTTARQFYFDVWHELLLRRLAGSRDPRIAEIAAKALKEVMYHAERSADWVIRMGDGTELSHARMQSAVDDLWMYTGEMFAVDDVEQALVDEGIAADVGALMPIWRDRVASVLDEATLTMPSSTWMQQGGKHGVHTEHLSRLLAEMQSLHRAHPGVQW